MKTIALIDGDILVYYAAYAAHGLYVKRYHAQETKEHGRPVMHLDENGNKLVLEVKEKDKAECLMECVTLFEEKVNEVLEKLFTEDYKIAIKGKTNFRDDFYDDYKMPRHKQAKKSPVSALASDLREVLSTMGGFVERAVNSEADDLLRIWHGEIVEKGVDQPIICTVDKDLKCIPGLHYHLKTQKVVEVDEHESLRIFYSQLLSGDSVDNIPGLPKIGPITADKLVCTAQSEEELQEIVVSNYIAKMGMEDWLDWLKFNGSLLYILKTHDDKFDPEEWEVVKEIL